MNNQAEKELKSFLTATETARILGVSPETVMLAIENSTLPIGFVVKPAGSRSKWKCRVVRKRLEKYLEGKL